MKKKVFFGTFHSLSSVFYFLTSWFYYVWRVLKKRNMTSEYLEKLLFEYDTAIKGVLHPRPILLLFVHFSQKLQHLGEK